MKQVSFVCLLLVALAVAVGCNGCGGGKTTAEQAADQGVLILGNDAEPKDLDPHVVTGIPAFRVVSALFEGLVTLNPETLEPEPGVAARWDTSDDGRTYRFELQPDAKWSNGEPLTAGDFVYSWKRVLSPGLAAEYASLLFCLRNAEAYHRGDLQDFARVGVRALGPHTLEVQLASPTPYFLTMLILPAWMPVHQATLEQFDAVAQRSTAWTRAGNLVGNGPFLLSEWQANRAIVVRKNAHYWDHDHVSLNEIRFLPMTNRLTEERSFRTGELHMTASLPSHKIAGYRQDNPDALQVYPIYGTYFYRFNVTRPPLDDARVRRALAMAIDRRAIVEHITRGGERPAPFFTPPEVAGYSCATRIPHNVALARTLLAQAGYPNGEGLRELELLYNTSESHKMIAEAIQDMWHEALGVKVRLVNQDWKVYLASTTNLEYDIARSAWIGDYLDPSTFLNCFRSDNPNNRTGWSLAGYDRLLQQADALADHQQRLGLFQQAEALLLQQAPLAPIYFYSRTYLRSPQVAGIAPNPISYIRFKDVRFLPQP